MEQLRYMRRRNCLSGSEFSEAAYALSNCPSALDLLCCRNHTPREHPPPPRFVPLIKTVTNEKKCDILIYGNTKDKETKRLYKGVSKWENILEQTASAAKPM